MKWSKIEENCLKKNYNKISLSELREKYLPLYSKSSIYHKASRLNLTNSPLRIPLFPKGITFELVYILGVILGDGYFYHSRNKRVWNICLKTKDLDFVELFKKNIELWTNLKGKLRKDYHSFCKQGFHYEFILSSKKVYLELSKYVKKLDKRKFLVSDKIILNNSKKIKVAFLKGIYDSEGCVAKKNKVILLGVRDEDLRNLIYKVLILLKIFPHKVQTINQNKFYYYVSITKKDNIEKFSEMINFSINYKKQRLKRMIESYKK